MINRDAPFPQANDFNKVIAILATEEEKLSDYETMSVVLGDITARQVDYYVSACIYLGLINSDKTFTDMGNSIRSMSPVQQNIALAQVVVSDEIFGRVYFSQKLLGIELERDDVVAIMKQFVSFNSERMYERRASTVMGWVRWIIDKESI